jgi:hypothetical protein
VNQAILAWSLKKKIYWQMTKPILLDSLYTVGAISIAGAKSIAGAVFINKIVNLKFF